MASNAICGHCGTVLSHPSGPCPGCGSRPLYPDLVAPAKSPVKAAMLAVVPGMGHLYLGEWRRALGFMGAAGVLEFFGFDLDLTAVGAVVGVPMEIGGFGLWLYSIVDAYQTARRRQRGII
jgi:hypothetical protein